MTDIVAQKNHVIFRFVEDIQSGRFVNATSGGILISSKDTNQSNMPRWGLITHVGPECLDAKVGDYALIEPGRWTNGFYVDDVRFWKTDELEIMALSDSPEATY